jgi:hypothetical protein
MHESYHTEGLTDLSVIRAQAEERLRKGWPQQEETLVHLHPKRDVTGSIGSKVILPLKMRPCNANSLVEDPEDKEHIWYLFSQLPEDERPYVYRVPEIPTGLDSDAWIEEGTRDG